MASAMQLEHSGLTVGMPEHEDFWEEYLKKVIDEDIQLVTHWQKTLDILLIYVGLFIAVLTAFIIQVSSVFQPNPGDATNKILISIYNHTMNTSTPIDLQQYVTWTEIFDLTVSSYAFLLYISLGISITEAASALIISIWLTRYQRSLTRTGPTIHERIRQRHEAYTGLMEWRLPVFIEILPMVALLALVLFAGFISKLTRDTHRMTGIILGNIFIAAFILFVSTASLGAFISGSPFHSPLSDFIRFIFQVFPNWSILGFVRVRTVCVTLLCLLILPVSWFLNHQVLFGFVVFLQFLTLVSLLSLCEGTRAENKAQEQPKPRLFTLATWIYIHFIIILGLSFTIPYLPSFALRVIFYSLRAVVLLVTTLGAMKMSRQTPDEGKAKAEAVAWMIKTQPSHNLLMFQNAVEVARNYAHLRSSLLKEILPILDALIRSIRGDREKGLKEEEKVYITLLAILVDFEPCKASFWRNEAAMKRPDLSDALKEKLHNLSCDLSGCTIKAEAEFILGKVGEEEDCMRKGV